MKTIFIIVSIAFNSLNPIFSQPGSAYIVVLGITQDGGYPHLGCERDCCARVWKDNSKRRFVVSLAVVDPLEKKWWLIEATPDIREQLQLFRKLTKAEYTYLPDGIFVTHAHIGHYGGLMQVGKEVLNTHELPVYVMPRMKQFLETNGPWSQLVNLKNIILKELKEDSILTLNNSIGIEAFRVPHRDEFSETAGFKIIAKQKSYLFIPDIDKWSKWSKDIVDMVKQVDVAFLDATFYEINELKNRKIEEVPHPLVSETMKLFEKEVAAVRSKIVFIHFNHTNPMLFSSKIKKGISNKGFNLSVQGKYY